MLENKPVYVIEVPYRCHPEGWVAKGLDILFYVIEQEHPGTLVTNIDEAREAMLRDLQNVVFAQTREELEDIAKNYSGHQHFKVRTFAEFFLDTRPELCK